MKSIALVVLLFGAWLAPVTVSVAADRPRPNILLIFTDDQRADTIAALGNRHIQTPHLDRLVRRGLAFRQAYMQGSMNGATCVPSRAMLLSGRSLFRCDENLTRDETWPAAFGRAGYTTFISGKWHNTAASVPLSFQRAQSLFNGGMTNPLQAPLQSWVDGLMEPVQIGAKHACEVFTDETLAFLSERHESPFFAYLALDGPHDPHIVPADYPLHYDPEQIPLPLNFLPQHPFDNGEMTIRDEKLLPWPRSSAGVRAMLADYYRYISYLDMLIGRVLDALDASPYAKNTIVIFSADSGVGRGSHGLIGKQNLYEHSVRVPLVISGPGIAVNQTTDAKCYLYDLLPTLGAWCGITGPGTSEGLDLSATLRDPSQPGRSSLMFAYKSVQRALREGPWKLIRYPKVDRTQLFNLESDPEELNDLSGLPEHAERIADMTAALVVDMGWIGDAASLSVAEPSPAYWTPPVDTLEP